MVVSESRVRGDYQDSLGALSCGRLRVGETSCKFMEGRLYIVGDRVHVVMGRTGAEKGTG